MTDAKKDIVPESIPESITLTYEEYQELKGTSNKLKKKMDDLQTKRNNLTKELDELKIPSKWDNTNIAEKELKIKKAKELKTDIATNTTKLEACSRDLTAAISAYMQTTNYKNTDPDYEKYNILLGPNGGGSKSRRIRRRKHNRKTRHKHARKTRHKRTHRSRTARKHKKYSRKY